MKDPGRRIDRRTAIKGTLAGIGALWAGKAMGQIPGGPLPTLQFRTRTRFNDQWKFALADPSGAEQPSFDDSAWRTLTLPHDWSIEGPFDQNNPSGVYGGFSPGGIGWYRKTFTPPPLTGSQRLLIEFEGIYRYSIIWLNGNWVGARPNGFVSVQYDLTPYLNPGQANVLAVRADNSDQPNLRWYSGSGIYRHVWLTVANLVAVDYGGTYITTSNVGELQASISVVTTIANFDTADANTQLDTLIYDGDGRLVADAETLQTVPAGATLDVTQNYTLLMPDLWSPDTPNLYTAYSLIRRDGVQVDDYLSTFGIRDARFDPDAGFFLNGQSLKLKGLCIHHDLGCLGSAAHDRAIERRLAALQSIGCNALRLAHNPAAPHVLDMCDRMGIMLLAEAFDKWSGVYAEGDFASPDWDDWWQQDLGALLVRDRNHPSVILWSVGNEAGPVGDDSYTQTMQQLVDFVHQQEPSRLVTSTFAPPADPTGTLADFANAAANSATAVDVVALNYQEQYLDLYRAQIPKLMLSTEAYPYFRAVTNGYDSVNSWWDDSSHDFDAGEFVWVGADYLGETAGWPSKGWPNGLIDTCSVVKARAAFHSTIWNNDPAVHLAVVSDTLNLDLGVDVWRWPESAAEWNFAGQEGRALLVTTVSNCDTVEVIVNGVSQGVQSPSSDPNLTLSWYVLYAPGTVQAIGRNGGNIVAQDMLQTAGKPATIQLVAERNQIAADGLEVAHIDVTLQDSAGITVPDQDMRVSFVVSGPARLIGVDNGDLRSMESYQGNFRTTYQGRALAVIQSTGAPGLITFTAFAQGLPVATTGIAAMA